ncbi:MFS transporter [Gryllotalpicola ginsengisoli]|uniref:MFS transporter n=1 Tax=Gryllotalpicola ginsengisoli TaxID=444608 RepID=UPI0003B5346F|nr:MFS transporter [Gryllotalpicola ginsengisoli]
MAHEESTGSILKQPIAVWAIAFACVVSFMGIGLVDPILPAIAEATKATATQTELLFTTYLLITGAAMFFTSWLSSRIGAKLTLLIGLAVIVVFAALAGASGTVGEIIGFRAGWGLGNALFISTALASIVGAAAGGAANAIILYESALGLGLAIGPLVGGLLGNVSWRGPFFGTAVLMAIGFVAIITMLRGPQNKPAPTPLSAPFRGLARPGLAVMAVAALFYNMGFFVLLAWTPFALQALGIADALSLGYIFFGWGVALAITSVFGAPLLTARMRRTTVLLIVIPLLAITELLAAFLHAHAAALIVLVVVGGLFLGILNTVLTECSMEATDLPRPVASSAYSGVRFLGGAVAPPLASWLAGVSGSTATPFYFGFGVLVVSTLVVLIGRGALKRADGTEEHTMEVAEAIAVGDAD